MTPTPAVIAIWDHDRPGATVHAMETLKDRTIVDPERGRFLLVVRDPTKLYDWNFSTEAQLLEKLQYIFDHNDCSRVSVQWHTSEVLANRLRALHKHHVPEFPRVN
jgi:hypothetical protein